MYPALLYKIIDDKRIECRTCRWYCGIGAGKSGVCRMYTNDNGLLYNLNYAMVSSVAADPIEKKPLYHFHLGTRVLSLGSWGCNFHCSGCQNWEIACPNAAIDFSTSRTITPEKAVDMARDKGCAGIAWTYNEPTVWFEYTLDGAQLAKKAGLYTVYVTNGYMSIEALDEIGPYLGAFRVDVKAFSDQAYRKIAKIIHWRGILETAERAKKRWGMHVEVVTNVIPGINDDDAQLSGIARWIKESLGELTPWHLTRFHSDRLLTDTPPTPLPTLQHAQELAYDTGLKFVYLGNVGGVDNDTLCYGCGQVAVQRWGYNTKAGAIDANGRCAHCGTKLNIRQGESYG